MIRAASLILLAIYLANASTASASTNDDFEKTWAKWHADLEADGFTKPLALRFFTWTELGYTLGYCKEHVFHGDLYYWQAWTTNTPAERSPHGRALIAVGQSNYIKGSKAGDREHPSFAVCNATVRETVAELDALP